MDRNEAVNIINEMINSIKENPHQFNISVKVIGQQITSHGGTGLSISATGGGPGSTTIGQMVTAGGNNIKISQEKKGIHAMNAQFNALLSTLEEIKSQFEADSPDKGILSRLNDSLVNTWVPGVIGSVISALIKSVLG